MISQEGVISELERKLEDKLGLTALIIKPTQRMVKYKQFLDIMLAGTEVCHVTRLPFCGSCPDN